MSEALLQPLCAPAPAIVWSVCVTVVHVFLAVHKYECIVKHCILRLLRDDAHTTSS